MWFEFALCYAVGAVFMVAPGLLFLRLLGMGRFESVSLAPIVSISLLAVVSLLLPLAGIPCAWWTILVAMLLPALALFVVRRVRGVGCSSLAERVGFGVDGSLSVGNLEFSRGLCSIALSVAVGLITCLVVYLTSIGSPEAFIQNYDSAFHATHLREFIDSGNYSSLSGGFYPSAWHAFAASIASVAGASPFVATNAANSVIASIAYPLSIVGLLAAVFPDKPRRVVLGALFCTSIAYYPWRIMLFGPLYPNVLSFSLMPAAVACFIVLCSHEISRGGRARYGLLFVASGIALALSQPNAIFSAGVFLVPYIAYRLFRVCADRVEGVRGILLGIVVSCATLALIAVVWVCLATSDAFHATVTYPRDSPLAVSEALRWASHFSFVLRRPQYVAGCLVALGALVMLLSERGRRWIPVSYLITVLFYVVAISCEGHLREMITGFWYNDYHRLAAAVSVFAIVPLAAGLDCCLSGVSYLLGKLSLGERNQALASRASVPEMVCWGVLLAVVTLFNSFPLQFLPGRFQAWGFDAVRFELRDMYSTSERGPLDSDELAFLDQVLAVVEEDAIVANQPFDGSVFAYASNDLNVLFDRYNVPGEEEYDLLRNSLSEVATNQAVCDAVDELGVSYVLQLDSGDGGQGLSEDATFYPYGYEAEDWRGINEIDENTPGFSLVLSEGDMRLYEIG